MAAAGTDEGLSNILRSMDGAVIATDLGGRIVRMNPAGEVLTGWSLTDATEQPVLEILRSSAPDTQGALDRQVRRALEDGVAAALPRDTRLLRRDGVERLIAGSIAPIKDAAGRTTGVVAVFRDVTVYVEAQYSLVRALERRRAVSEVAREFAAATGELDPLLTLVSRRISDIVGDLCMLRLISADGKQLTTLGSVHHPDPERTAAAREFLSAFSQDVGEGIAGRVAATGQPILIPVITTAEVTARVEPKFRPFLESLGITSLLTVPLFSQGRVIGVLSLVRSRGNAPYTEADMELVQDLAAHASLAITNNRLLESSKRELAERMQIEEVLKRGFLEAAPDAVLIVDPKGRLILVNSQTEILFGYERAELIGQPIEMLVPPRFRAKHPAHRTGYFANPAARPMGVGLNLYALRKDGTEFAAEISLSPIPTPEGTLIAAAVRDVTERRRELEERNHRMQEANRLKSEFLANMSHELRTPLNAIIGFAALMHGGKAGALSEVHKEYLGDILNSSRHLLQLINDVLDLAKVESGRMELRVESVDLAKVVNEVKDIVRGIAAERHIRLGIEIDPAIERVSVDQRMLKQVLYNYLSNALKFTPDGGRVTLRIKPTEDQTFRIEVEDTGIGIKPEDLSRLFVEFQQLDQGTAKRYPGTGLGLALTKRIVHAQGGSVSVNSVPGEGSTFFAVLPREVKVVEETADAPPPHATSRED